MQRFALAVFFLLANFAVGQSQEIDIVRRDMKLNDDFVVNWVADLRQVSEKIQIKNKNKIKFKISHMEKK